MICLIGGLKLDKSSSAYSKRYQKYELMSIRLTWFFICTGIAYLILTEAVFVKDSVFHGAFLSGRFFARLLFLVFILAVHFIKYVLYKKDLYSDARIYYACNIIWLFILSFAVVFMDFRMVNYVLILFTVLAVSFTKGTRSGLIVLGSSAFFYFSMTLAASLIGVTNPEAADPQAFSGILYNVFAYIVFGFFTLFCGMIHKEGIENEIQNKSLMEQLEEKYLQLETAQEEIKVQYEKLKGTNSMLEDTNKKLSDSIAEFYTLQQISQAIGSILDIKELLKYLNDIILGVMGVSYSTIILYDEKANRLKVHTTNISNANEMAILVDNINSRELFNALNSGRHIIENQADSTDYEFLKYRDIKSLICIPLNTKTKKFGLVLVEHKHGDAFDDDDVRLLKIIAQQVGIAMENAELYQKMQELASRDGLTGVYNRQYFQSRLELEVKTAQKENYPLSLAIFDIDHFKRFNDTFGHLFGDKVLKDIIDSVASSLRKNDIIARFGGEEFIILFPHTSLNEAYEKVESLRKMISGHIVKDNLVSASVTASFGVSCFSECALLESELVRTADDALYEAKESGRNCIKVARRLSEL